MSEAAKILSVVLAAVSHTWTWFVGFMNTNFSAALFGAFGGAWAAHAIAVRTERHNRLRQEIAGVNAAIALSNTISNVFITIKKHHVRDMMPLYKRGFDAFIAVLMNPPDKPRLFEFINDFRELDVPYTAIVELRETLLNRVPSSGGALSIAIALQQCIESFENLLENRNRTIDRLRAMNEEDRVCAYFGVRNPRGHIDERYADQMTGLLSMVDSGIYFPMLLCEVLTAHGNKVAQQLGRGAPKVAKISYAPFEEGLLPDPAEFPDYEDSFRPKKK
ncbi:MAG: hypothetical protein V4527_00625 [Pseudomonadota bacterium]